ncbi:hypothetical protein ATZ35_02665 [Enterococcus rotai]|uniref:Uncharacterized protein n=1 Tax=Enterococcus rotai TaxID=118060 RepID=A0A0U2VRU8_9ENTE|nr:hypothetical protein ATZ35_02665 [Enterococcus rotai]
MSHYFMCGFKCIYVCFLKFVKVFSRDDVISTVLIFNNSLDVLLQINFLVLKQEKLDYPIFFMYLIRIKEEWSYTKDPITFGE